jgi:release factor glutamine methyltransferase
MAEPAGADTLGGLMAEIRRLFRAADMETADLDARILLLELTGSSAAELISRPQKPVEPELAGKLRAAAARRLTGEPVHRILGWREFHGLKLMLSPGTLEPRPDTECLVEALLPHVRAAVARNGECRILDLGTGTGAIALALIAAVAGSSAVGVDISPDALATADRNAHINGIGMRFSTLLSDWLDGVEGDFHIIVSNPPYIPTRSMQALSSTVRDHDPPAALDGGPDGLACYRIIARRLREYLVDDGVAGMEFGFDQSDEVIDIFSAEGFGPVELVRDLAGHRRAAIFR